MNVTAPMRNGCASRPAKVNNGCRSSAPELSPRRSPHVPQRRTGPADVLSGALNGRLAAMISLYPQCDSAERCQVELAVQFEPIQKTSANLGRKLTYLMRTGVSRRLSGLRVTRKAIIVSVASF